MLYSLNADIETQIVLTFYLFQDRGIMYVRRQVKSIIWQGDLTNKKKQGVKMNLGFELYIYPRKKVTKRGEGIQKKYLEFDN